MGRGYDPEDAKAIAAAAAQDLQGFTADGIGRGVCEEISVDIYRVLYLRFSDKVRFCRSALV